MLCYYNSKSSAQSGVAMSPSAALKSVTVSSPPPQTNMSRPPFPVDWSSPSPLSITSFPEPSPSSVSPLLKSFPSPLSITSCPKPFPMKVSPSLISSPSPLSITSCPEPSPSSVSPSLISSPPLLSIRSSPGYLL